MIALNISLDGSLDWLILSFPLLWLGIGRRFPFALLGEHGVTLGKWLWFFISIAWLAGALGSAARSGARTARLRALVQRAAPVLLWGSLVLIPALDLASWKQFASLGYPFPKLLLPLDLLLLAAFFLLRQKLRSPANLLRFAIAASIAHLVGAIFQFPIVASRSDMLPICMKTLEVFLSGQPAYSAHVTTAYRMPFLPLLWLSFAPAHFLHLDPRWMVALFRLVLGALALKALRQEQGNSRLGLFWSLFFLNPYLAFRHDLYLDFFWALLFLAFLAARNGRPLAAAVVSGILGATLQWGWLFIPFILMTAVPKKRWGKLIGASLLTAAVSGVFLGYFYWKEGAIFTSAIFEHFKLAGTHFDFAELCLGLAGPLLDHGWAHALMAAQKLLLLAAGIAALRVWWKTLNEREKNLKILEIAFFAIVLFIMINPLVENYYYLAPWLVAGWLCADGSSIPPDP